MNNTYLGIYDPQKKDIGVSISVLRQMAKPMGFEVMQNTEDNYTVIREGYAPYTLRLEPEKLISTGFLKTDLGYEGYFESTETDNRRYVFAADYRPGDTNAGKPVDTGRPGGMEPIPSSPGGVTQPSGGGTTHVTAAQLDSFEWVDKSSDGRNELNAMLTKYGITSKNSIALFMATCGHESDRGLLTSEKGEESYFQSNGYTYNTRGAGYIQVTGSDQALFLNHMGVKAPNSNTAEFIAENYAWESAAWEWAVHEKGGGVVLNTYVNTHGTGANIFLITQYFINGYLKKEDYPLFDSDLASIRGGTSYTYDTKKIWTHKNGRVYTGTLYVNGRNYRLPIGFEKRMKNYEDAIKVFK